MSDNKPDPATQLQEAPTPPETQTFYMVPPDLMQQIIAQLGERKASEVHGLLNALNNCQSATAEVKRNG